MKHTILIGLCILLFLPCALAYDYRNDSDGIYTTYLLRGNMSCYLSVTPEEITIEGVCFGSDLQYRYNGQRLIFKNNTDFHSMNSGFWAKGSVHFFHIPEELSEKAIQKQIRIYKCEQSWFKKLSCWFEDITHHTNFAVN